MKNKLLVSSCLLGNLVRYDGNHSLLEYELLTSLSRHFEVITICPEVAGGLAIPRTPCEIFSGEGIDVIQKRAKVLSQTGADCTNEFLLGAQLALQLVKEHKIKYALLKAKSPSCGNQTIYDGSFSGKLVPGVGVTAAILEQHGVRVFNEKQIQDLIAAAGC